MDTSQLPDRPWLTMAEAARHLGISRQRMHQIVQARKIKTDAISPRMTVISRKELARLEKLRAKSASRC